MRYPDPDPDPGVVPEAEPDAGVCDDVDVDAEASKPTGLEAATISVAAGLRLVCDKCTSTNKIL